MTTRSFSTVLQLCSPPKRYSLLLQDMQEAMLRKRKLWEFISTLPQELLRVSNTHASSTRLTSSKRRLSRSCEIVFSPPNNTKWWLPRGTKLCPDLPLFTLGYGNRLTCTLPAWFLPGGVTEIQQKSCRYRSSLLMVLYVPPKRYSLSLKWLMAGSRRAQSWQRQGPSQDDQLRVSRLQKWKVLYISTQVVLMPPQSSSQFFSKKVRKADSRAVGTSPFCSKRVHQRESRLSRRRRLLGLQSALEPPKVYHLLPVTTPACALTHSTSFPAGPRVRTRSQRGAPSPSRWQQCRSSGSSAKSDEGIVVPPWMQRRPRQRKAWCLKRAEGGSGAVGAGQRGCAWAWQVAGRSGWRSLGVSSFMPRQYIKMIIRILPSTQGPQRRADFLSLCRNGGWDNSGDVCGWWSYNQVIQMSKDLTSQFTKTLGQQSGSAKSHLDSAVQLFGETSKLHDLFAKDLAALAIEVAEFKEKVKKNPHELKKFLVEKMRPLEDELMIGEESQKQENKSAQEIITEIKRENKETSEAIVKTFEKLKHLEIKIGQYH